MKEKNNEIAAASSTLEDAADIKLFTKEAQDLYNHVQILFSQIKQKTQTNSVS